MGCLQNISEAVIESNPWTAGNLTDTTFYGWSVGVPVGTGGIPVGARISAVAIPAAVPAATVSVQMNLWQRNVTSAYLESPPGAVGDVLLQSVSLAPGDAGLTEPDQMRLARFAVPSFLAVTGTVLLVEFTAFDGIGNRLKSGIGRTPPGSLLQYQRGFYRSSATSGYSNTSSGFACAVSFLGPVTCDSSSKPSKTIGTRMFGGRMNTAVDNTTPSTYRTIETLAARAKRVRVIFGTSNPSVVNIAGAAIAAINSAANYACSSVVWLPLTFNGVASGVIPAQPDANRRGFLVSDWCSVSMKNRVDTPGALPLLAISAYLPDAASISMFGEAVEAWASRADRPHVMRINHGDCVTTPANFTSTTNQECSPILAVQYEVESGEIFTIAAAGDSITEGAGASTFGVSWGFLTACALQTPFMAVEYMNLGWDGVGTDTIENEVRDLCALGINMPNVLFIPNSSPNYKTIPLTSAQYAVDQGRVMNAVAVAQDVGILPIVWTTIPTNPSVHAWGASDSFRCAYNDSWRALAGQGIAVADFDAALAGITDGTGQVNILAGMSDDGIHPNDAGNALLETVAAAALGNLNGLLATISES